MPYGAMPWERWSRSREPALIPEHHLATLSPTVGLGPPRVGGDLSFSEEPMEV